MGGFKRKRIEVSSSKEKRKWVEWHFVSVGGSEKGVSWKYRKNVLHKYVLSCVLCREGGCWVEFSTLNYVVFCLVQGGIVVLWYGFMFVQVGVFTNSTRPPIPLIFFRVNMRDK